MEAQTAEAVSISAAVPADAVVDEPPVPAPITSSVESDKKDDPPNPPTSTSVVDTTQQEDKDDTEQQSPVEERTASASPEPISKSSSEPSPEPNRPDERPHSFLHVTTTPPSGKIGSTTRVAEEADPPSASSATSAATSATSATSAMSAISATSALSAVSSDAASASPTPIRRLPMSLSSSTNDDDDMSTLPDPRKRAAAAAAAAAAGLGSSLAGSNSNSNSNSTDSVVAEDEVTTLSTKLIDAINYQSTLDDTLSRTRMELEEARAQIRKLEVVAERQKEMVTGGVWVRKSTIEQERLQFAARMRDERRRRDEAEQAKKKMEQELESLTAELFEQANNMVAMAKEEARAQQLAAARRHDNLRAQLADTEGLLRSQQEQLAELKQVMEDMITEGAAAQAAIKANAQAAAASFAQAAASAAVDDHHHNSNASQAVRSYAPSEHSFVSALEDSEPEKSDTTTIDAAASVSGAGICVDENTSTGNTSTSTIASPAALPQQHVELPQPQPPSASYPTSFTHLVRPVLRFDTAAYTEFLDLIRSAQVQIMMQQQQLLQQTLLPHARSPSSTSMPKTPPIIANSNDLAAVTPPPSSPVPLMGLTAGPSPALLSATLQPQLHVTNSLKETKFYKRVLVEDIEPALRLDTAPGISWLGRRGIMSAMLEGTLVAEPMPSSAATVTATAAATAATSLSSASASAGTEPGPGLSRTMSTLSSGNFSLSSAASSPSSPLNSINRFSPCALCGESRREEAHLRRHRFRLTESDRSPPYALCGYCLGRVRAVCDFLGFLRLIKDGHWRADDAGAEHAAWEEAVRLREQMFWSRIGGGVLPVAMAAGVVGENSRVVSFSGSSSVGRHSRVTSAQSHVTAPPSLPSSSALSPQPNGRGSQEGNPGLGITTTVSTPSKSAAGSAPASPIQSSRSAIPHQNRMSMLSSSMAALVSGFGGHVV